MPVATEGWPSLDDPSASFAEGKSLPQSRWRYHQSLARTQHAAMNGSAVLRALELVGRSDVEFVEIDRTEVDQGMTLEPCPQEFHGVQARLAVAGLALPSRSYDQVGPCRVRRNLLMELFMKPDPTHPHDALSVATLLALIVAGHVGGAGAQTPKKLPSGDPCTVVPLSDVQKAFPGAKPGVRSTRVEKYGLTECEWKDGSGVAVFGVQEFYGRDNAMDELRSFGMAMVEGKAANARNLRYEILTGVGLGSEAVAFVETSDAPRGIVSKGAMLALHRGERTLFLTSPVLPERDRAAALKTFEVLGRIAAKRLD